MQIEEVELYTHDLTALHYFYEHKLGMVVTATKQEIDIKAGSTRLIFRETQEGRPYYHFAFNVIPNTFKSIPAWLQGRAEIIKWEGKEVVDFPDWNAQSIYFLDPVGNIVEFIARYDLPEGSHTEFHESAILNVSEVGLVADPVVDTRALLEDKYGLPVFHRQQPTNEFSPMGDDEGLFILVTEHRNWFPTNVPCKPFPLDVTFKDAKGERRNYKPPLPFGHFP